MWNMEVKRNLGRCPSKYSFPITNLYNQAEPDNSQNQIGQRVAINVTDNHSSSFKVLEDSSTMCKIKLYSSQDPQNLISF